jgi:hypothetical protein
VQLQALAFPLLGRGHHFLDVLVIGGAFRDARIEEPAEGRAEDDDRQADLGEFR